MHKIQKDLLKLAKQEDINDYGLRKLGEQIGVDHPQKVKWHLGKLLKDGHLYKDAEGHIAVANSGGVNKLANVPILGLANCGEPLSYADETNHGYLTVSKDLLNSKNFDQIFAVQATGDSMNKSNISGQAIDDGDYVIVDSSKTSPSTGDYIVSSVEGLANVKRFVRDETNRVIALVSESTRPRPPIVISSDNADSYRVHGRVVGVVKNYAI